MTPGDLAAALRGRVSIPYEDPGSPGRRLVLECYRPAHHAADRPVVLVQHGMGRNGDEYRDAWIPAADRHGLLIVATTFPEADWPGPLHYNDGHVRDEAGAVRPREGWSNAIPARVFGMLLEAGVTVLQRPYLWGHSAGGQFVHRLVGLQGPEMFEAVGVANAGWFTLPTLERPYPEGLGEIGLDDAAVERLLTYPTVIFAGDEDVETRADNLPKHEAALAQGPHRFARAHFYLEAGRAEAKRRGVECGWQLVPVPGVGHEGQGMAAAAAGYWFEGRVPQTVEGREVVTGL